jgi:RsiW-degrading membrane proteinase PrsW (M82 family)
VYFAGAWLLLLWVIIRPANLTWKMAVQVAALALVLEAPLAIWLETELGATSSNILGSVLTIGIPEELAKVLPVAGLALYFSRSDSWRLLTPRDYLFLGAISGLVFGSTEAVHYFTLYAQQAIDVIGGSQTISVDQAVSLFEGSTLQAVWRFVNDAIAHACWAGISGYFVGLAMRYPRFRFGLILFGLALTSLLHGLNDLQGINGNLLWIAITVVSVLMFLAYAQSGRVVEEHVSAQAAAAPPPPAPGQWPPWAPGTAPPPAPGQWAPRAPGTAPPPGAPAAAPPTAPAAAPPSAPRWPDAWPRPGEPAAPALRLGRRRPAIRPRDPVKRRWPAH